MSDDDQRVKAVSLTLAEIARTLESIDAAPDRVQRALELLKPIVPYARCAVLSATPAAWLIMSPPAAVVTEREKLRRRLEHVLSVIADDRRSGPGPGGGPANLTVPITGLDQVLGVLTAEADLGTELDASHLRFLMVVASQLGAYFSLLKLRDEEAQANRKLVAAHDFQQLLVGIVSHDLRNPLSVITVAATNLLRKAPDPALVRTYERTLRCAKKANRIINDLLDVTHTRVNGELKVQPRTLELKPLLREIADDVRTAHPGVAIELDLPEADVTGEWDSDRVSQAVGNLLNNAIQHGDEGVAVSLRLTATVDAVRVAVTNRGAPIPPDTLEVMFDPFAQGGGIERRRGGGLGLGLYIVKQIVEAHGGEVVCRSDDTSGTTFELSLPKRPGERPRTAPVLVVDDDLDVRASMVEMLEAVGYAVATATNGETALAQIKKGMRPRLVLLDLHMPVMDGATFCARFREDPELQSIPVLVLSSDRSMAAHLTQNGATGFLPKPVQVDSLLATMKRVIAA